MFTLLTVMCYDLCRYIALYPSVQLAIQLRIHSCCRYATDAVFMYSLHTICAMICAVIFCPVSFSANGYSDYNIHSCCAATDAVFMYTDMCVLCLCRDIALYPSVQLAILITTKTQLLCDATDSVLRTRVTLLC